MPIATAVGAEPIPGYHLVARLGFGGYGEVWKVSAPGGLFKALKIVYGDLSGPRAEQELKAMERIKGVRHPFLLSLERFEVVGGQLLILSELADRSLQQRFQECRDAGQPGIPRDELLGYLRDAAEALDYMNETHGLQHLDIKPENLLLLGGRVKIADFGLVKEFRGPSASMTGGVTPIYATPEAFDGRVSRYSDQYSLAIVYQEMLTGVRPFPGTTAFQLAAQHSSAPPLLDSLPVQDRKVIARALAKIPEQRYPSCRDMAEALRMAPVLAPARQAAVPPGHLLHMDTVVGNEPTAPGPTAISRPASPVEERVTPRTPAPAHDSEGLRPTLYLGLGGLAAQTLARLHHRLGESFGSLNRFPLFGMVLLDTDRASLRQAQSGGAGEGLSHDQVIHCPLYPTEDYRDEAPGLLRWLHRRWLYNVPRSLVTEGLRPLGRLAFVTSAPAILAGLRRALEQITTEAAATAAAQAGRGLRTAAPRIFVVAAITGGTGGGMLIDAGFAVRQVLNELGIRGAEVSAVLVQASGPQAAEQTRGRVNAHATLREVFHWTRPSARFPGTPEAGLQPFPAGQAPFHDCYYLQAELSQEARQADVADILAEYLHFDATRGGKCLDRLRLNSDAGPGAVTIRSCGLAGLRFPRRQLVEGVSQVLSRQLVERWRGDVTPTQRDWLRDQTREQLVRRGLTTELLIRHFHEGLAHLLSPELQTRFTQISDTIRSLASGQHDAGEEARVLAQLDDLLGTGNEPEAGAVVRATSVETALQQAATVLGEKQGQEMVDEILERVETPGERLRAAEVALDELSQHLLAEAQQNRDRLAHLAASRRSLRQRLLGQDGGKGSGLIRISLRKLRLEPTPDSRLATYFTERLEELVQGSALTVLSALQARVTALTQELARARQRLNGVLALMAVMPLEAPAVPRALTELFPFGVPDLRAAIAALQTNLPTDLVRQFDLVFQAEVLDVGGGLWGMLSGQIDKQRLTLTRSAESVAFWSGISQNESVEEHMRDALMMRARELVGEYLRNTDVAGLLLDRHAPGEPLREAIGELIQSARPLTPVAGNWQHLVVLLPDVPDAVELREPMLEALSGVPVTLLEGGEELIVSREVAGLSLPELAAAVIDGDRGIAELARRVLTREDVRYEAF